ncbi:hypothetical protein GPA19_16495 [Azoarcus indigens]|uniref:Uncharacterized protein n=1 Tax=Azoarcus indigens TaxID=29545 RepID=A0A4R6DSP0_9RHOO|nr:hypothetical protein [Azoarcus indigens]NMG66547.1 hypothetical protein [Azoarcus indigens]TDN48151.1 hypothetical protein C7389_11656 [Azoarcus indigens]
MFAVLGLLVGFAGLIAFGPLAAAFVLLLLGLARRRKSRGDGGDAPGNAAMASAGGDSMRDGCHAADDGSAGGGEGGDGGGGDGGGGGD